MDEPLYTCIDRMIDADSDQCAVSYDLSFVNPSTGLRTPRRDTIYGLSAYMCYDDRYIRAGKCMANTGLFIINNLMVILVAQVQEHV